MNQDRKGPSVSALGPLQNGNAVRAISNAGDNAPTPARQDRVLIDKHGHLHTEAILSAWSPAAIKVLGVRRLDGGAL